MGETTGEPPTSSRRRALGALGLLWPGGRPPTRGEGGGEVVTGRVLVDGRAPVGWVLLISDDMTRLLGGVATDEAGNFAFPTSATAGREKAVLLVKVQGPILAVAHRVVGLGDADGRPLEVNLASDGPGFHRLRARIEPVVEGRPPLRIVVTPTHLDGVPAALERFFLRRDERVVEAAFSTLRPDNPAFQLTVQAGSYRIGGESLNKGGPVAGGAPTNHAVVRVDVDGEAETASGERLGGFVVEVDRDLAITLVVAAVAASPAS